MELGLNGKNVLVTASSAGIGLGVAISLFREGANVAICGRDAERLAAAQRKINSEGEGSILTVKTDLRENTQIERLVDTVISEWGNIEILVTNTGGPRLGGLQDFERSDWEEAFATVFWPVLSLINLVVPGMRTLGWGRIVFLTSTWAKQPRTGSALSTVTRSAIAGLSKYLALELAEHKITVNHVLPGPIQTERSRRLAEQRAQLDKNSIPSSQDPESLLKKSGVPSDIGDLVAFLVSDRSTFTTGTSIQVDGGQVRSIF